MKTILTTIIGFMWFLLNIISSCLVVIDHAGIVIINLSQGKTWNGKKIEKWPQILKIGRENWILPYHFMVLGMLVFSIFNPTLGEWLVFQIFIIFASFECLGIVISYIHKWTDEAGMPLWSSVEYGSDYWD